MCAIQGALSRAIHNVDYQWFVALYAVSALLTWAFGWVGYCAAFAIAVLLRHRIRAFSQRNRSVLRLVEAWYFADDPGGAA